MSFSSNSQGSLEDTSEDSVSSSFSLICGGDLMLNNIPTSKKPLAALQKYFKEDIVFANLEVPLTTSNAKTEKKTPLEIANKSQYILKADPKHIDHLSEVGINMVALGNNHIMDYGMLGLTETKGCLTQYKIAFHGAGRLEDLFSKPAVIQTQSGVKVGMISYLAFLSDSALNKCTPCLEHQPGVAVLKLGGILSKENKEKLKNIIHRAKRKCDFLLVAPHWGNEKQTLPRAYQISLGRALVEAGADLILGSHPHVLQGAELYRGRPIFYSLGNLVSSRSGKTALFKMNFVDNKILECRLIPCDILNGQVKVDPASTQNRIKEFNILSKQIQKSFANQFSRILQLEPQNT